MHKYTLLYRLILITNSLLTFTHRFLYSKLKKNSLPNNSSRSIKDVSLPDGNCFFCALGLQLGGFEELHQTLRELLVQFISCNQETFASWVTSGTMQSHLNNMQRNAKWATQVEIQAAASLFQVPIYVATNTIGTQGIYRWIVFQPHDKSSLIGSLENPRISSVLPSFTTLGIVPHFG